MGNSGNSDSKEMEEYKKTVESETVKEIAKISYTQNIYVTGNYDINFFKKYFIEELKNPKPDFTSYYKMARHAEIREWHFFFAPKSINFEEIKKNTIVFFDEHYEEDPDDFSEGKDKGRTKKITIIYFNDKNSEEFLNYFTEEHNQYMMPFVIFIGDESENSSLKIKAKNNIKKFEKYIDINSFKFLNIEGNKESFENRIKLIINLIDCSAFYNELGHEFKFPKKMLNEKVMDNDLKEYIKNFFTFNILVAGRPGAGKSTFINGLLKERICKAERGGECSSKIVKYIHYKYPLCLYDSPGISEKRKMITILKLIREKNKELQEMRTKIHAVFYIVDGISARSFLDYENLMFKYILEEMKIPVYFILTKVTEEKGKETLPFVISNFKKVTENLNIDNRYKGQNVKKYVFYVNVVGKNITGLNKLFTKVYDDFKGKIVEAVINERNIREKTSESLLGILNYPNDIIVYPRNLCQYIKCTYRLLARSIKKKDVGATNLSAAFLKEIRNVYGLQKIDLKTCKEMIAAKNFTLDEKYKEKSYNHWFYSTFFSYYQTPAEEEIDYLGYDYIEMYENELKNNVNKCLDYINKLRVTMNESINGLYEISHDNIENEKKE